MQASLRLNIKDFTDYRRILRITRVGGFTTMEALEYQRCIKKMANGQDQMEIQYVETK